MPTVSKVRLRTELKKKVKKKERYSNQLRLRAEP